MAAGNPILDALRLLRSDPSIRSLRELQQMRHGSGIPSRGMPVPLKFGSKDELYDFRDEAQDTIPSDEMIPLRSMPKRHPDDEPEGPYDPNREPKLRPGEPEPIAQMLPQMIQQVVGMVAQNPQMLQQVMQMASAMIPNMNIPAQQRGQDYTPYERMPHPNEFYNERNPYSNDYGKGAIQEVQPPRDWLDPEMEMIERRRGNTPPRARELQPLPSDPVDTMDDERNPIDPEDLPPPIQQMSRFSPGLLTRLAALSIPGQMMPQSKGYPITKDDIDLAQGDYLPDTPMDEEEEEEEEQEKNYKGGRG